MFFNIRKFDLFWGGWCFCIVWNSLQQFCFLLLFYSDDINSISASKLLAIHTYIQCFCLKQTTNEWTVKHKSVMYIFLGILRHVISLHLLTAEETGHWIGMLSFSKDVDLEKSVISAVWNYFTDLTILGTSGSAREEQKFACNKLPVNL